MILAGSTGPNGRRFILASLIICLPVLMTAGAHAGSDEKRNPVWIAFFSSKNCPKCTVVKQIIREMRSGYPIKVREFDIGKRSHYDLMVKLEAIHSDKEFAVPLVLVGDTILMGEDEITSRLEPIVGRLADSGGSPLPYLGPGAGTRPAESRTRGHRADTASSRCNCGKDGRPPSIGDEWDRIRKFVGGWL